MPQSDTQTVRLTNIRRQPCEILTSEGVILIGPAESMDLPASILESSVVAHFIAKRALRAERMAAPESVPDPPGKKASGKKARRTSSTTPKRKPARRTASSKD